MLIHTSSVFCVDLFPGEKPMESNETLLSMNLRSGQDSRCWCANISNTNGKEVDRSLVHIIYSSGKWKDHSVLQWQSGCSGYARAGGRCGSRDYTQPWGEREHLCHSLGACSEADGRKMEQHQQASREAVPSPFLCLEKSHCNMGRGVNWETWENTQSSEIGFCCLLTSFIGETPSHWIHRSIAIFWQLPCPHPIHFSLQHVPQAWLDSLL